MIMGCSLQRMNREKMIEAQIAVSNEHHSKH